MHFGLAIVLSLFFSCSFGVFGQPLSGILPKNDAFVDKNQLWLSWNSLPSAINYSVEIAQNPSFTVGFQQSGSLSSPTWQTPILTNGVWYWRVIGHTASQNVVSEIRNFRIFQPNNIVGNSLWLAADSNVTLTGNSVSAWTDISGNGHVFSQPNSSDQPSRIAAIASINDQSVVRFDGASDYLNGGNILNIGTNSLTTFVLAIGSGVFYSKFGNGSAPFNIYSSYAFGAEEAHEIAGTTYQAFTAPITSNYHVLNFIGNRVTSNGKLFRNFNQLSSSTLTGISSPTYNFSTSNPLLIGRYSLSGTPFFLNGDIAEIIFYNIALSDVERQMVQNHLMYKYAPPLNLGSDTTIISSFCSISLSCPSGFTDFLWSTGETSSVINVNASGTYWLSAKNIFGVTSVDTIQVHYPEISMPQTTNICSDSNIHWNTNLGSSYSYLWSTGEVTSSISVSAVGNYWVKITDGNGCFRWSDTLSFSMDNYETEASLGNDTTLCSGNTISLQIGESSSISFLWQDGSTAPSFTVNSSGSYSLQSVNVNGCLAYDTISVVVSGTAPVANFSSQDGCVNTIFNFADASVGFPGDPVSTWQWNFGDGQTSSLQNPSPIFDTAGILFVQLQIFSLGGCGAVFTDSITIFERPIANFSAIGLCSSNETSYTSTSSTGSAPIVDYSWDFGQPSLGVLNFSTDQNPIVINPIAGTFLVTLSVEDQNNCSSDTAISIVVHPSPILDFDVSNACEGQSLSIENNSIVNLPAIYLWDFGDGTTSNLKTPSKIFSLYGTQYINLSIASAEGCTADSVVTVSIHPFPQAVMEIGPACVGTYVHLVDESTVVQGTISNVSWIVNNTDTLYGDSVNNFISNYNQQQVKLIVESDSGCVTTLSKFFTATVAMDAAFSVVSSIVSNGIPVSFTNTSIGGSGYIWNFGDGETSSSISPNHVYSQNWVDSSVLVSLIAKNDIGCIDTAQRILQIQMYRTDLFLSNLFFQPSGNLAIMGVELKNKGSVPIQTADLTLFSEKGLLFQETWTGNLQPGESENYVFLSKPFYNANSEDALTSFYCVEGSLNEIEIDYSNNKVCKNVENSQVILLPIYPNPVASILELNLLVSQKSTVSLEMYDERGSQIVEVFKNQDLSTGLYKLFYDTEQLVAGCYFVRLMVDDNVSQQKIIIVH